MLYYIDNLPCSFYLLPNSLVSILSTYSSKYVWDGMGILGMQQQGLQLNITLECIVETGCWQMAPLREGFLYLNRILRG